MKTLSDVMQQQHSEIPNPDPDMKQSWRNSPVTQWVKGHLQIRHQQTLELLAEVDTGDQYQDIAMINQHKGELELIAALLDEYFVRGDDDEV